MSTVQNLINNVSQKVKALETAQALYSRQLSPKLDTFEYMKKFLIISEHNHEVSD